MGIVKLPIVILKLIAKLRECISYFRSSGGQTVARSNVTGRDGTTNNQMGIELQNTDENSIIASFYICRKWRSCKKYSLTSELHAALILFIYLRVSSIR